MPRMLQIHEDDLAELERSVPELADALLPNLTPALRVKLRRCQSILSRVRWNYGPAEKVERIDAGDSDQVS